LSKVTVSFWAPWTGDVFTCTRVGAELVDWRRVFLPFFLFHEEGFGGADRFEPLEWLLAAGGRVSGPRVFAAFFTDPCRRYYDSPLSRLIVLKGGCRSFPDEADFSFGTYPPAI